MLEPYLTAFRPYGKKVLSLLLPYRCVVCDLRSDQAMDLCKDCEASLPWLEKVCERCQERLSPGSVLPYCGACLIKPPVFDRLFALFAYDFPVNSLIYQLKFSKKTAAARVFGELFAKTLQEKIAAGVLDKPEALLPVPLHRKRLGERGYNQATLIALSLKETLQLPVLTREVIRNKQTEAQATLELTARMKNIKNAFSLIRPLPYQHVAVIDDVVTSSNTVSELVSLLKRAGVTRVQVWSVCKTLTRE